MGQRTRLMIGLLATPLLVGACTFTTIPGDSAPPAPTGPITIELVNYTSLDVMPRLYVSATDVKPWKLFTGTNLVLDFTDRAFPELRANEKIILTYECDQLASFGVNAPILVDAVALSRLESEDREFFVVGEDVQCEATIRFSYYSQQGQFIMAATER